MVSGWGYVKTAPAFIVRPLVTGIKIIEFMLQTERMI
jgi:hypothetical protein